MALQPSNRPAGSAQILRFTGSVVQGGLNAAYPKANGEYSSDVPAGAPPGTHVLRLLLADATDLTNQLRRFPEHDFDDSQPAGSSPHAPTFGLTALLNATDANISDRTWTKNTYVTVQPLDAASKALLVSIDPRLTEVCLDSSADSGLGTSTGLPVLCLGLGLTAAGAPLELDILIEIRHTGNR